jgi:hypothetical protein
MLRALEQEQKDRRATEVSVLAQIRLNKATWKKEHKKEFVELEKQLEVLYEI